MNKTFYKIFAVFFGLMSLGGISESYRIMTSSAPDIVPDRGFLTIMSLTMLAIMLTLTRFFWRKSK